jgi:putative transposase
VHRDDPGFGYRFIADWGYLPLAGALVDAGHELSERRVWKVCSQAGIVSAHARKRGRWRKPGPPVHEDLVERDFTATGPNRLWLTDITEHPTAEGKLYLCAVKDVWSRRIVGYAIDSRMTSHLAVDALEMAIARRGRDHVPGCVVHADRGSQFRSRPYVAALHQHGLHGSLGRVASSADNAAMESFFSLLQKNILNARRWDTRDQLRLEIVTWTERTYHRRRRQRALGKLTPVEFETINRAAHAA